MTVRLNRKIPVLMMWLTMASMAVRFAPAQSPSAQTDSEAGSGDARKTSTGAHTPASTPGTASQWTAGAHSFGSAGNSPWGAKPANSEAGSGAMWEPGTQSFGFSAQPGGIWRVRNALSMGTEQPATPRGRLHNGATIGMQAQGHTSYARAPGTGPGTRPGTRPGSRPSSGSSARSFHRTRTGRSRHSSRSFAAQPPQTALRSKGEQNQMPQQKILQDPLSGRESDKTGMKSNPNPGLTTNLPQ